MIEFVLEILTGNGIVDFAIGWGNSTTGTSELNLYTYKDETIKEVPTKELYNELAVVEFESGKNGILTIRLQTKESPSTAKLFINFKRKYQFVRYS